MTLTLTRSNRLTRRERSKILVESLEPRTLLTAALVQTTIATPVINETVTPVGPDQALVMNQFNPTTGTLLSARVNFATDAHIFIDSTITNPINQPDVTGSYSGTVTTTIKVPGQINFPGIALTSSVTQPLVNFVVHPGPGTQTDGSDGKLVIHVDLTQPLTGSFTMNLAQATAAGYVGASTVQGSATGTGSALFSEQGGGNETAVTTKFAHSTATIATKYFYIVPGSISGRKFQDNDPTTNSDNAGDPGLAGWIIDINGTTDAITDDQNNVLVAAGTLSTTTTTIAGGTYTFSNLAPGTYTITEDPINFINHPNFVHTFGGPYVVTIAADGTATAGSKTGNDFGNFPITPAARIFINPPTATNEVNANHTFTATVEYDDGLPANQFGGDAFTGFHAIAGQSVTFTLTPSNGAFPVLQPGGSGITDAQGHATVIFTSATAGKVVGNAAVTVNGLTVDTDPATAQIPNSTDPTRPGGGSAQKLFVDADIKLTPPTATNEVNSPHTITVTVEENDGNGSWFAAPAGTQVTLTLANSNGATATFSNNSNTITVSLNASGQANVQINSATAGLVTINATTTLTVGGVSLTRATGDGKGEVGHLDGNAVTKKYVDADITINPPTAINPVGTDHVLTITVEENDGNGSWFAAPAGTLVSVSLINNTANATFVAGGTPLGGTTTTVTLGAGGTATVTINGANTGDVTIHASVTLNIGGVSVTRATGDGKGETGHLDSPDALKHYVGEKDIRMTGGGSVFLTNFPNTVGGPVGTRVTHGFELHCSDGPRGIQNVNNHLEINWNPDTNPVNSGEQHFHLLYLTAIDCFNDPNIDPPPPPFTGGGKDTLIGVGVGRFSGNFNGVSYHNEPATITFILTDAGEPGVSDTASYIVKLISNNKIVLNTGDTNGDGVRDVKDFNAMTAITPIPPTANTDHGTSDIPDQLFLFKGNHQVHFELKNLTQPQQQVENRITTVYNQLDNNNMPQSKIDDLIKQLDVLNAQFNAIFF